MIKQATEKEIPIIEEILACAVEWMNARGLPQWTRENVTWANLSKFFRPGDFCIAYAGGTPAGCMALIDHDPSFWPDIPKGESLFIHKLAVVREFAGQGYSTELIGFAKDRARALGIRAVRLDCRADRPKVRAVYEKQGFVLVEERAFLGKYATAFYVYPIL